VPSALSTSTNLRSWSVPTAASRTRARRARAPLSSFTRANSPGARARSRLANTARVRIVPEAASSRLSTKSRRPACAKPVSVASAMYTGRAASRALPAAPARYLRYVRSSLSKYTCIESTETIVARSVASGAPACTRFPSVTTARPMRPEIGARTCVHPRLRRAVSTAAAAPRIPAAPSRSALTRVSNSSREIAWWSTRVRARATSLAASAARDRTRSSSASARSNSARYGRGSMSNSTSPARTSRPSVKRTRSTSPATRGRTSAASTASRRPVNWSDSSISRVTTAATVTCGGGGGGGAGVAHAASARATAVAAASATAPRGAGRVGTAASRRAGVEDGTVRGLHLMDGRVVPRRSAPRASFARPAGCRAPLDGSRI
jgi:hypothetical protein